MVISGTPQVLRKTQVEPSGGHNCHQHILHGLQEVQDGLVLHAAIFGCDDYPQPFRLQVR